MALAVICSVLDNNTAPQILWKATPQCTLPCGCSSTLKDQEPWKDSDGRRLEMILKALNPSHHILETHATNCSLTGEYLCTSHPSNAVFSRRNTLKWCLLPTQALTILPFHREGKTSWSETFCSPGPEGALAPGYLAPAEQGTRNTAPSNTRPAFRDWDLAHQPDRGYRQ